MLGNPGELFIDQTTGSTQFSGIGGELGALPLEFTTQGIATMDFPEIFAAIYGKSATPGWTAAFLKRFGGRPDTQSMPNLPYGKAEFFMALYLFMQHWAAMFSASIR